ncbi:MAG: polysaccharide biosynthesis/export family protein [Tabrizicola sp.]
MTVITPMQSILALRVARCGPSRRLAGALLPIAMAIGLAACSDSYVDFPVRKHSEQVDMNDVDVILLDRANIASFAAPARGHQPSALPSGSGWSYRIGNGDVLSIIVFDHPELTLPAGPQRTAEESGFQVGSNGAFTYPYIGEVTAAGRSIDEVRAEIAQRLAQFIPDPQVDVRIAAYKSQFVSVSGEVRTPLRAPVTSVPLTLVEAINAAGGATEAADLRRVTVQRGGKPYSVDLKGFFEGGLTQNNPVLRHGDVVHVPRRRAEEAYLLGEIARPDVIDLSVEPITLTQAIARNGGLLRPRADARGVLVFRWIGGRTRVFQLDTSNPVGLLLGTQFLLEPGDVVYVLRSPIQKWNDTIARILPTVQGYSAVDGVAE